MREDLALYESGPTGSQRLNVRRRNGAFRWDRWRDGWMEGRDMDRPKPTKPARRPSIREIARLSGVSITTVSRVINDDASVATTTRAHVRRIIDELGYSPDPIARAMSSRRTRTIGVTIPTVDNTCHARFLNAFDRTVLARGYAVILATTDGDPHKERAEIRHLLAMRVDGLVLTGATHASQTLDDMRRAAVPAIFTSTYSPEAAYATVGHDNRGAAIAATRHLVELGHRRISVIHDETCCDDRSRHRIAGVRAAAAIVDADLRFVETEPSAEGGVRACRRAINAPEPPTALLCLDDSLAIGALCALNRAGVAVPRQISVMGFGDGDWSAYTAPALTTMRMPAAEMGATAAAQLIDHLENGRPLTSVVIASEIAQRDSVAPPEFRL